VVDDFVEAGIDFERANAARMYDFLLGGGHNFAVDRAQVAKVLAGHPGADYLARANRAYLGRVVRWCLEQGVNQFLDLGSGVPTVGNVHEIAHQVDRTARIAYVDFEPVAVAHACEILTEVATVSLTHADIREPRTVLEAPGVVDLLDFTRPVAVLAVAVLHFIPEDIADILAAYQAPLAAGSVVALSHASDDQDDPVVAAAIQAASRGYRGSATEITLRRRAYLLAGLRDELALDSGGHVTNLRGWDN
jgi:hypothetical protein